MSFIVRAAIIGASHFWRTSAATAGVYASGAFQSGFRYPAFRWSSFWAATIERTNSCPKKIASIIVRSETSRAPASTMTTASSVPATMRSTSDLSRSALVGFTMNFPSTRPTRTAPTGV